MARWCLLTMLALSACAPDASGAGRRAARCMTRASTRGHAIATLGDRTGAALENAGASLRTRPPPYTAPLQLPPPYVPDGPAPRHRRAARPARRRTVWRARLRSLPRRPARHPAQPRPPATDTARPSAPAAWPAPQPAGERPTRRQDGQSRPRRLRVQSIPPAGRPMNALSTAPISAEAEPAATEMVIPVILSGGSGSRLWPVSPRELPETVLGPAQPRPLHDRRDGVCAARGPGFAPPVIVCNNEHRFLVAEQLRDGGIADARIVLEPVGRNSAPAVAAGRAAGGADRSAIGDLDDGRRLRHRGHRRPARDPGPGRRRRPRRAYRDTRDASVRAGNRLRLHGGRQPPARTHPACTA